MTTKVAIVKTKDGYDSAFQEALRLIGGIEDLNLPERSVTIKIGLFDPRMHHHTCTPALRAMVEAFDRSPRIALTESDNYCAPALDRLQRFSELFSERVIPFSLSDDPQAKTFTIAGEEMQLSSALLKPNVFISTHVWRTFTRGSILKNLFGCTPMVQKAKYHKNEIFCSQLCDIFEVSGGIDLAMIDGTYLFHNASDKMIKTDILIVGRDAVAVETVGAVLAGLKPEKLPQIQAFVARGLGEGDINNIEIVGISQDDLAALKAARKELKRIVEAAPRMPGISDTIDCLTEEGWMDTFRTGQQVADELQQRGVSNATKAMTETTLKRRVGKTLEQAKEGRVSVYRRKQE